MTQHDRDSIFTAVRDIGRGFTKPADDWVNTLIVDRADAKSMVIAVPFHCAEDKEIFARALPGLFRQWRPTFAAFVVSAWVSEIKPGPLAEVMAEAIHTHGSSADPNRFEQVIVELANRRESETWRATITRHDDRPPTLGEFERDQPTETKGRFAGGFLQRAMQGL